MKERQPRRTARPARPPGHEGGRTPSRDPRHLGGEQVEGRQAVRELLAAGKRRVKEVLVAEGLEPSAQLDEIERLASRKKVKVSLVGRRRLETIARTDSAQGVLAFAAPLEETPLDEMCDPTKRVAPFLLVLDGIGDPQNLGALLRSAECAGVTGVVMPRHRAAHVTPTVTKVAAGAVEHLRMAVVAGIPNALLHLKDRGVFCLGLDAEADSSLYDVEDDEMRGAVALVLGAEDKGLGSLSRRRCDRLVSIPRQGAIESLNVSSAGAVACFELARRRLDSN